MIHPVKRSAADEADIAAFFQAVTAAEREGKAAAAEARAALPRLVAACYGHDNSQAITVVQCLASIYNGSEARPVRLDDIRALDWSLQKDLAAVIIGVGKADLPDHAIREAFAAAGGPAAVDWFHWYTTGGIHRQALVRLVDHIKANSRSSSGVHLRSLLESITQGTPTNLSKLNFEDDDLTRAVVIVLDGLFGRDQGMLHIEDIATALEQLTTASR